MNQHLKLAPVQIDDLDAWFSALSKPTALTELLVLGLCVLLACLLVWGLRRVVGVSSASPIIFGRKIVDGALAPLFLLCLAYVAKLWLAAWIPLAIFKMALPLLWVLFLVRLGLKVLLQVFGQARWVRVLERSLSWLILGVAVLWVSGFLPLVLEELEQIQLKLGTSRLSARTVLEAVFTTGLVLIFTLWLSSLIEGVLLRHATRGELSLRKALSHAMRAFLLFFGLLLALSLVGIDLTTLSVLGGAVGVGVGLGLQKLAANYVSGFVILAERSLRIGDNVRVDNFEGLITNINARYTVVRSLTGRESIVPNEMLTTTRVENFTLADTALSQTTVVHVVYGSDVQLVMRLLMQAALQQTRVLRDPEPSVALSAFASYGLEFTLSYWLADPENGQLNLRSQINVAILQSLCEQGVVIATLPSVMLA